MAAFPFWAEAWGIEDGGVRGAEVEVEEVVTEGEEAKSKPR